MGAAAFKIPEVMEFAVGKNNETAVLRTQGDGSSVLFYLTDYIPLITPKLTPVNLSICLIDKPFFLSSLITSFLFCFP